MKGRLSENRSSAKRPFGAFRGDGRTRAPNFGDMKRNAWANILLLIPFVATLFPGMYNRLEPHLFGMPFFYWYQLVWTIGSGVVLTIYIAIVHGGETNAR